MNSRIHPEAQKILGKLPPRFQCDVRQFLAENIREELYEPQDVLNAWLVWNGLIGYTNAVMTFVKALNE